MTSRSRVRPQRLFAVAAACVAAMSATALPAIAATKPKALPTKTASAKSPPTFPKMKVLDLATAKTIDLASLNVTTKPQLIWFWAPT